MIQRREQRGCGNTAGGSAQDRPVRSRRCDPHLPVCVHPSPLTSPRRELIVRVLNSRLRRALQCERLSATASKPRWTWRERFLSGSSPPRCARIATTPDTAHPAHRAAIVEGERDKCGGTPSRPLATGFECDISPTTSRLQFPCGRPPTNRLRPDHSAINAGDSRPSRERHKAWREPRLRSPKRIPLGE